VQDPQIAFCSKYCIAVEQEVIVAAITIALFAFS